MSIIFRLDRMMADRKMPLGELARRIDLTDSNLSILKTGKAKAVRVSTLDALCRELRCQPGDLLEFVPGEPEEDLDD
ncbi:MAG: helix-turn-helix transcriptional regulator [Candidatus Moduliflexus flocculans]|nr:helix-turn-helix transcriptional regulator [Candidatus Moduliflexus flocculans]